MNYISIVGYENDDVCSHCNRKLIHCIRTNDGELVGAQCFAKVLTKPRIYNGKKYRLTPESVIRLAKSAQFWSTEKQMRNGLFPDHCIFERS